MSFSDLLVHGKEVVVSSVPLVQLGQLRAVVGHLLRAQVARHMVGVEEHVHLVLNWTAELRQCFDASLPDFDKKRQRVAGLLWVTLLAFDDLAHARALFGGIHESLAVLLLAALPGSFSLCGKQFLSGLGRAPDFLLLLLLHVLPLAELGS